MERACGLFVFSDFVFDFADSSAGDGRIEPQVRGVLLGKAIEEHLQRLQQFNIGLGQNRICKTDRFDFVVI